VHDLGKIGPQHQLIVQKPAGSPMPSTKVLRTHAAVGADIVARVRALQRASELVRTHHEQPDGRGYPNGLEALEVPRGAHIIHVADSFDAMTSDRPYRRALPLAAALEELERGRAPSSTRTSSSAFSECTAAGSSVSSRARAAMTCTDARAGDPGAGRESRRTRPARPRGLSGYSSSLCCRLNFGPFAGAWPADSILIRMRRLFALSAWWSASSSEMWPAR